MTINWEQTTIELETVDWDGNSIILKNVKAERNPETGDIVVDPVEVGKAEITNIAGDLGVSERDMILFMLVYVQPGPFEGGSLAQKYKMNKMLFYFWKKQEGDDFEVFPHDKFIAAPRGPIPEHLWEDLERLQKEDYLRVKGISDDRGTKEVTIELRPKGKKIAKGIWNQVPKPFREDARKIKMDFLALSPEEIMHKVHRDFPEFRGNYVEPDTGDPEGDPTYPPSS